MTSSNRRSLVAGGVAVAAALTSVLLSACGAGQVAQTAQIQSAVPGANAQAPGRLVFVRNATVDYPGTKGYPQGAGAALTFWVFNNTQDPVSLVGVGAAEVTTDGRNMPVQVRQMTGANTASPCAVPRSPSMPPAPTNSASTAGNEASPSGSGSASGSKSGPASASASKSAPASASASASPSPSPSASASAAGSATFTVTVPPAGCVELSRRAAQFLQVADLPAPLGNQQAIRAVFEFTGPGGTSFTIGDQGPPVLLPVGVPASALPRSS